jgi:hypothetical protein
MSSGLGIGLLAGEAGELYTAGRGIISDVGALAELLQSARLAASGVGDAVPWWTKARVAYNDIEKSQNVALATFRFGENSGTLVGHSGRTSVPGTVPPVSGAESFASSSVGTVSSKNSWSRGNDAESKLLEYLDKVVLRGRTQLSGSLLLQSELETCASCSSKINEFTLKYPNITVKVQCAMDKIPKLGK